MLSIVFGFDVKNQTAFEDIFSFDTAICFDMECEQNRKIYRRYAEEFVKYCQKYIEGRIVVSMNNVYTAIDVENIYFIEVIKRIIRIHHRDGIAETYDQLKNIEERLDGFGFIKTHRSYLVATKYIKTLEPKRLILENREEVIVSRNYYQSVKDAFLKMSV